MVMDLRIYFDLCLEIGSYLLIDAKKFETKEEAKAAMLENIKNKKALGKLMDFVGAQGGNVEYIKIQNYLLKLMR